MQHRAHRRKYQQLQHLHTGHKPEPSLQCLVGHTLCQQISQAKTAACTVGYAGEYSKLMWGCQDHTNFTGSINNVVEAAWMRAKGK